MIHGRVLRSIGLGAGLVLAIAACKKDLPTAYPDDPSERSCIIDPAVSEPPVSADVIVYAATPGGITAAAEAAHLGKKVLLLEPTPHVGGKFGNGIGIGEIKGNAAFATVGGLSRSFYARVQEWYDKPRIEYALNFEPRVAETLMQRMACAEPGVTVVLRSSLDRANKTGTRIQSLIMRDGRSYSASQFIDASYEGDLLAAAGVSSTVGREAISTYNEPSAGVRGTGPSHNVKFDPYVVPGQPSSGTIPLVEAVPPGPYGSADSRIQAFTYRVCVTPDAKNRVPFSAPEGYDPGQFEALARMSEAKDVAGDPLVRLDRILTIQGVGNNKFDINNVRDLSVDFVGGSNDYPLASAEDRLVIAANHERYVRSLLYFLTSSPRLRPELRAAASLYGYCKDEYTDNNNFPRQLYVREARRMLGTQVMTENELKRRDNPKPIGVGSYWVDSHTVRLFARGDTVQAEGHLFTDIPSYQIPYSVLTPRSDEASNLLVPVCISASRVALMSLRLEPTYMIMGQAAGAAAAMAIDQAKPVQEIDYEQLAAHLRRDGQVLDLSPP